MMLQTCSKQPKCWIISRLEASKSTAVKGKFLTERNDALEIITKFFKKKFVDENTQEIEAFEGNARPLNKPIELHEVVQSLNKLNNNRAVGPDGIPGKLYKYGSPLLSETITDCFNNILKLMRIWKSILETWLLHTNLENLNVLLKLKFEPTHPLEYYQKSSISHCPRRIRPAVLKYISPGQSSFQPIRSTADVVDPSMASSKM